MPYQCMVASEMIGSGSRHDAFRPLFRDEYRNCSYSVVTGGPPDGSYVLTAGVPDDDTKDAIVADERFPSWDWAEVPQIMGGAPVTL